MSQIFAKAIFSFSESVLNDEKVNLPIPKAHFGVVELQAVPTVISTSVHEVVCVVDQSGSMSDTCKDGRTKMHHIVHTLKNIIHYFAEHPEVTVFLTVHSFDDSFHTILDRTLITEDKLKVMLVKIDKLRPTGNTNIEIALSKAGDIIRELSAEHPTHVVTHIFMTDGEATSGSRDKRALKNLVVPSVQNAFIGFGIDHDSGLLNFLGSYAKSAYYFIDALEKSGLVYGEILHSILYKLLEDVTIELQNGFIYDYKKNTWDKHLVIGDIAGEATKVYHICSDMCDDFAVLVKGKQQEEEVIVSVDKLLQPQLDLTKYIYRQKTLQLLYEGNEIQEIKTEKNNRQKYSHNWQDNGITEEEKKLKKTLRDFLEELKQYMEEHDLKEDKFYKNLCDDIYICYLTVGTQYGAMFTCARQTSQGTQRCYTVSQVPDDNNTIFPNANLFCSAGRANNVFLSNNIFTSNNTDDVLTHELSDFADAPYLTPTAARLMSDISCGMESSDEEA
jgi:hypothetical protein